jgi:hypothetical protein
MFPSIRNASFKKINLFLRSLVDVPFLFSLFFTLRLFPGRLNSQSPEHPLYRKAGGGGDPTAVRKLWWTENYLDTPWNGISIHRSLFHSPVNYTDWNGENKHGGKFYIWRNRRNPPPNADFSFKFPNSLISMEAATWWQLSVRKESLNMRTKTQGSLPGSSFVMKPDEALCSRSNYASRNASPSCLPFFFCPSVRPPVVMHTSICWQQPGLFCFWIQM